MIQLFLPSLLRHSAGVEVYTLSSQVPSDIDQARHYWIKDSQSSLQQDGRFSLWKRQLGLFTYKSGIWRCGGRMSNSHLTPAAQNPILLDPGKVLETLEEGIPA